MSTARKKKFSANFSGVVSRQKARHLAKIFGRQNFERVNRTQRRVAENFRSAEL